MIQDFLPIKSPLDKPELSSPEKHVVPCIIIIGTCIMSIKNTFFLHVAEENIPYENGNARIRSDWSIHA